MWSKMLSLKNKVLWSAACLLMFSGSVLLTSNSPVNAVSPVVNIGETWTLHVGQSKVAATYGRNWDRVNLIMQGDGNLVLYQQRFHQGVWISDWIWQSATSGSGNWARMQGHGNLVVYSASNTPLWHSNNGGNWNSLFVLSGDGNMAIYNDGSATTTPQMTWQSHSSRVGHNTGSASSFTGPYADGAWHSYNTIEPTTNQRKHWDWRFNTQGAEWPYEPTDLTISHTGSTAGWVDVVWEEVPQTPGIAVTSCVTPLSGNRCDQFLIQFENTLNLYHSQVMTNAVCHEFGHTVGFDDGGWQAASCMTGANSSRLRWWERSLVNNRY